MSDIFRDLDIQIVRRALGGFNEVAPGRLQRGSADILRLRFDQSQAAQVVLRRVMDGTLHCYIQQMAKVAEHPPLDQWVLMGHFRYAGGHTQVVVEPMTRSKLLEFAKPDLVARLASVPEGHVPAIITCEGVGTYIRDLPIRMIEEVDRYLKAAVKRAKGEEVHEEGAIVLNAPGGSDSPVVDDYEQAEALLLDMAGPKIRTALLECAKRLSDGDARFSTELIVVRVDGRSHSVGILVDVCARTELAPEIEHAENATLASAPLPQGTCLLMLVTPFRRALFVAEPGDAADAPADAADAAAAPTDDAAAPTDDAAAPTDA